METYTEDQLMDAIRETWKISNYDMNKAILYILKGELKTTIFHYLEDHDIYYLIIKDPKYHITSAQLCSIMDEGNHCLSRGSIFYEEDLCYITWSNLGHI